MKWAGDDKLKEPADADLKVQARALLTVPATISKDLIHSIADLEKRLVKLSTRED